MRRLLPVWAGAIAALGCAARAPRPSATNPAVVLPGEGGLRWLSADTARARGLGASAPRVLAVGAGAPGDNLGGRLEVGDDACGLFMARGSGTLDDLDLFVYGDDGASLGEDETSTATPTVLICPPHPAFMYAFGRVASGHGLFAVSGQLVPLASASPVTKAFAPSAASEDPDAIDNGWPGLDEAVAEHRRALGGTFREVRRAAVPLDQRLPTRLSATTQGKGCVDLLVLPSEDVADVEIAVMDESGRIIGRSPSDGSPPAAVVCAEQTTDVVFELRPRAGRGIGVTVTSLTAEPKLTEAPGTLIVRFPTPAPELVEARKRLDDRLGREAPRPSVVPGEHAVRVGSRGSIELNLSEGCSRIDVIAGAPASGVEAWLWSSSGRLVAHDTRLDGATLFGCIGHRVRLDVEGVAHGGPIAVEVRPFNGNNPALAAHPLAAGRLLSGFFDQDRMLTARDLKAPEVIAVSSTARWSRTMPVSPGQCLEAGLGLGSGAEGAELRLVDARDDTELALSTGTFATVARACVPALGPEAKSTRVPSGHMPIRVEARVVAGAAPALFVARRDAIKQPAPTPPTSAVPEARQRANPDTR